MTEPKIDRRNVLIGSAATVIVGGLGYVAVSDAEASLVRFFKASLPGYKIDVASARQCARDFMAGRGRIEEMVVGLVWQLGGVRSAAHLHDKFNTAARSSLTQFLVNSNFFRTENPKGETIVYVSPYDGLACNNPFGTFDFPDETDSWPVSTT